MPAVKYSVMDADGDTDSLSFTITVAESGDSNFSSNVSEVATDSVGDLSASETSSESACLTAPENADTCYYRACVDSVTHESDTTNNCYSGVPITVIDG